MALRRALVGVAGLAARNSMAASVSASQAAPLAPLARTFAKAKAAPAEKAVEPPLELFGTAGRYASALFVAASKSGELAKVEKELSTVAEAATLNATFQTFMKDPSMPGPEKAEAMMSLGKDMKLCETTKTFLAILAENGRAGDLGKISENFDELMCASRGELKASVTTAQPLADAEMAEVEKMLKDKFLDKGQKLSLRKSVDSAIMGGIVVSIGDKHIDLSVKTKLRKMTQLLEETM